MIKRKKYLDRIIPFIDTPLIKALVGVRRSGKTVLLNQIKDYLLKKGIKQNQIIYINFESYKNQKYLEPSILYYSILEQYEFNNKMKVYLLLDELQNVYEWEKVIASFLIDINCDIFITGSNSKLLSSELATHIAGRYVRFDIYPFTFRELKEYRNELNLELNNEELFDLYLEFGGLPQCLTFRDKISKQAYLEDVFNTIIIRDIVERNKITDIILLKNLLVFLFDNIGNPFSANSIRKALKNGGIEVSVNTIINYVSYILKSLVISSVSRYDIKGKTLLTTNEKYYSVDLGLRNYIKSSEKIDYSKLLENVVYLEMLYRGYEIRVGKVLDYEVDFICYNKNKEKIYIQVAYLLANDDTINREFRPLKAINDNYPKYVISMDKVDFSRDGIKHYNIIDFLLDL